nr:kinesin-like protein KIN-7I [Onthophagus taurus]
MSGDNVEVVIRVRPLITREVNNRDKVKWQVHNNIISPIDPADSRSDVYQFDHIFDTDSTNEEVYDSVVAPLVLTCVEGYHCTIFTYGQTSSGKTHTMHGTPSDPGIIPRVIDQLFDIIDVRHDSKFLIRVAYVEIYNEKIYDLLKKNNVDVKTREDVDGNILILSEELVTSTKDQILEIMKVGKKNRKIYSTNMNINSSRSHTIFRIIVENSGRTEDGLPLPVRVSHFNLVDLAGTERVAQTKATGQRLLEGAAINKSLSTLTLVISQLTDENCKFRSYRDSKLTLILKNALGGNAKTLIVANITPASLEDTHSTLSFARRAKAIKNTAVINNTEGGSILLRQQIRIKELERELLMARAENKQPYNHLIKLNNRLFAKGNVADPIHRRHTISKTRDVVACSHDDIDNIFQVTSSTIPLTVIEKSMLRVARTNAIERNPSSTSITENVQTLPFEAQLDLSVGEAGDGTDEDGTISPDISIVDYSVCDKDLAESDTDEDLQEFMELEETHKTPTKDLQDELKKNRDYAATALQQYSQQVALNTFLKSSNQKLMDKLVAATHRIEELEKQPAFEQYNITKDVMTREIQQLTKELETEKVKHHEIQEELNINQEEYFHVLKEKEFLTGHIDELTAKNAELAETHKRLAEEPSTSKLESDALKIQDLEFNLCRANQEISLLRNELYKTLPQEASKLVFEKVCDSQMALDKILEKNLKKLDDVNSLKVNIDELTREKRILELNLQHSEQDLVDKDGYLETLKKEHVIKMLELKTTRTTLEKAEDELLELSQSVDAYEKRMAALSQQNKAYRSLVKFMDLYYESKSKDLKNILKTLKAEDSKKVTGGLFRVKSLPSLKESEIKQLKPASSGSLQNIHLCLHEPSFREISDDLLSLSQVLSRGPGNSKSIEMEESLSLARNRITTLQNQVERYLLDVESSNDEITHLKQRNRYLEDEMTQMQHIARDELKNQVKAASIKYNEMFKNYQESSYKEKKFERKYMRKVEECTELKKKYEDLNKTIDDVKSTSEMETLKMSEDSLKIENEYKTVKSNYENLQTLFADKQAEISKLEGVKKGLEDDLNAKKELIARLQASNSDITTANQQLTGKVKELDEVQTENAHLLNRLQSAENSIKSKMELISASTTLNTQLKETVIRLQEKITKAQSSANTQTEIGQQLHKVTEENKHLIEQLNQLHTNMQIMSKDLSHLQAENADLRNTYKTYKETSRDEIRSAQEQYNLLYANYQEAIESSQKEAETCDKLRGELEDVRTTAEAHTRLTESKIKKYEETIAGLSDKVDSLHTLCDSKLRMISQYQQKISEINDDNTKLRTELNNLLEVNEKLRDENWQQKVQAEDNEKQINNLLDQNEDYAAYVSSADQKVDMAVQESQELRMRIQQAQGTFEKRYNMLVMENKQLLQQNEITQANVEKYSKLLCERDSYILSLKSSHDSNKAIRKQLEREKLELANKLQSVEILTQEQGAIIHTQRTNITRLNADTEALQKRIKSNSPDQRMEFKLKKYMRKLSDMEEENSGLTTRIRCLEHESKQKERKHQQSLLDQKKEFEEAIQSAQKKEIEERKAKETLNAELTQLRSELHTSNKELRRYKQRCECESPTTSAAAGVAPWKTKRRVAQDTQREKEQGKETECANCKEKDLQIFHMECEKLASKKETSTDWYYQSSLEVCNELITNLQQSNDQLQKQLKEVQDERSSLMAELDERDKLLVENKKIKEKYQQVKAIAVRRNEEIFGLRKQLEKK